MTKRWKGGYISSPGSGWKSYIAQRGCFDDDVQPICHIGMDVDRDGNARASVCLSSYIDEVDAALLLYELGDFLLDSLKAELDDGLEEDCEELDDELIEDDPDDEDEAADADEALDAVARFLDMLARRLRGGNK